MLLGDVLNKDELSSLVIAELKEFGIKFRKEKKTKSAQVMFRFEVSAARGKI